MTDQFGTTIGIAVAPPIVVKKDKGIVTGTLNAWKGCCVAGTIVKMNLKQDHLLGIAMRTAATIQHLQPMLEMLVWVIVCKPRSDQGIFTKKWTVLFHTLLLAFFYGNYKRPGKDSKICH